MYRLSTPLPQVHGIGPRLAEKLAERNILTVQDFLLELPLRYQDFSQFSEISALQPGQTITIEAEVVSVSSVFRNRRAMCTATVADGTGRLKLFWFNNRFVSQVLKKGERYLFSGTVNDRGTLVQPSFERVDAAQNLHTSRLVPQYTTQFAIPQGTLRRILKGILDGLDDSQPDVISSLKPEVPALVTALKQLHFPEEKERVVAARERLALEELLGLIQLSQKIKDEWDASTDGCPIAHSEPVIPASIPFELTGAQQRVLIEVLEDLEKPSPMNRLLLGDVGSGKTVIAGLAGVQTLRAGYPVALVAPTKILAEQHFNTLHKLFPDMPLALVVSGQKTNPEPSKPIFWIGTHALINRLPQIKPGLVIYDEQHRFGVAQRSIIQNLQPKPHLLTMTATPIPRTLLLTIFAHLSASVIDELPKNRIPTKTWVLPGSKRQDMYNWLEEQVIQSQHKFQILVVCPFIDPSEREAFESVASATEKFAEMKKSFGKDFAIGLLHGRQSAKEKEEVIGKLFSRELDILVTTPIVEVGIDLPQASAIIIESAERYGMASLHQLRGRVGRAGQQGYCLLFTSSGHIGHAKKAELESEMENAPAAESTAAKKPIISTGERLHFFAETLNGQKVAELDLERRGAGDLFGVAQHGFSELKYGSWTNLELISKAQALFSHLPPDWKPIVVPQQTSEEVPLAN